MAKINMTLLSNQKEVLKYKNIDAQYTKDNIIFNDKYGRHCINRNDKTYERRNERDIFTIDFIKQLCIISFDGKTLKYDINTKYIDTKEELRLTYSLGEEEKIIIITKEG